MQRLMPRHVLLYFGNTLAGKDTNIQRLCEILC